MTRINSQTTSCSLKIGLISSLSQICSPVPLLGNMERVWSPSDSTKIKLEQLLIIWKTAHWLQKELKALTDDLLFQESPLTWTAVNSWTDQEVNRNSETTPSQRLRISFNTPTSNMPSKRHVLSVTKASKWKCSITTWIRWMVQVF